ncbi:MAG: Asp-tRNA(Asn)/Glu-tRNA(Gln) amidotransferase subunit GatA [Methanotrichaceae archaeon]|nr:Asp-tRNA(Asn)/Glu-tRNA(Gln) amidotransferase subunit GatA [Methanotrichaceae archaeon]
MLNQLKEDLLSGSAEKYLNKLFEKIEKSKLNAFTTLAKESALIKAREFDKSPWQGKLAGLPIGIKECISTKGIETTCSSRILKGYIPPFDAHVIEKLKNAGAIVIGKTNMDEFAMGTSTETSCFGPTRNPWDLDYVPGGSSGGSAAAVAGDEAPCTLGSDTGGSVRCPASFCGIVGLKPTYGLVSRFGLVAYANSLEQIGPLTNTVEDTALLMEVIAGHDWRDSTSAPIDTISYLPELRKGISGMKIGIPREYLGKGVDSKVEKAIWDAVAILENLGASWEEISLPNTRYALAAYYVIAMSEASSNLARYDGLRYGLRSARDENWHTTFSEIRSKGFGPEVKRRILLGTYALSAGYYGRYYLKALKVRTLIKNDFLRVFKTVDILASPTMPVPAFRIGERINDPLSLYMADIFTVPINLAGLPAISIPCGFSGNLPIGLQLIGEHFAEDAILRAAQAFEESTPFHNLRAKEAA